MVPVFRKGTSSPKSRWLIWVCLIDSEQTSFHACGFTPVGDGGLLYCMVVVTVILNWYRKGHGSNWLRPEFSSGLFMKIIIIHTYSHTNLHVSLQHCFCLSQLEPKIDHCKLGYFLHNPANYMYSNCLTTCNCFMCTWLRNWKKLQSHLQSVDNIWVKSIWQLQFCGCQGSFRCRSYCVGHSEEPWYMYMYILW